jgi:small subunit ribosomal protein S3
MTKKPIQLDIVEVRRAELDAQLIAEQIASQLMRRVAFRRAMKKTVQSSMRLGAQGVQIACAGRLAGAEIARREWYREGRMPLNTLRADIDYGFTQAKTTYGLIGVKCWVYHGEAVPGTAAAKQEREMPQAAPRRPRGLHPTQG